MQQRISMPLRLGFYLVRPDVWNSQWPEVPYRGIDRLPYLPTCEEQDALRGSGQAKLADLWDTYWDATDSRTLFANRLRVEEMRREFLNEGVTFDIVYAEVIRLPTDFLSHPYGTQWVRLMNNVIPYMQPVQDVISKLPERLNIVGFDLSTPAPDFHSAIFQPGLQRFEPRLPKLLNAAGLFGDVDSAVSIMAVANAEIPRPLPFCVIKVWNAA